MTNRPFWEVVEVLRGQLALAVVGVRNGNAVVFGQRLDGAMLARLRLVEATRIATDPMSRLTTWRKGGVTPWPDKPDLPSCGTHVARIEALSFPKNMDEISVGVTPLVLNVVPEPGGRWEGVTEVVIARAVAESGVLLTAALPYTAPASRKWSAGARFSPNSFANGVQSQPSDSRLGGYAPNENGVAILIAPRGLTVTKLAVVEGVVRGELWRAGRKHQVELPFRLTGVPVAAGIREPNPVVKPEVSYRSVGWICEQ